MYGLLFQGAGAAAMTPVVLAQWQAELERLLSDRAARILGAEWTRAEGQTRPASSLLDNGFNSAIIKHQGDCAVISVLAQFRAPVRGTVGHGLNPRILFKM